MVADLAAGAPAGAAAGRSLAAAAAPPQSLGWDWGTASWGVASTCKLAPADGQTDAATHLQLHRTSSTAQTAC